MARHHNRKYLTERRKELRNQLTPAEAYLWKALKGKQLEGRRFQRQHSIDNFIVDFYCPSEQLIVELDGEVHQNPAAQEKDRERDSNLNTLGFTVLRFENTFVFEQLDAVLLSIKNHFKAPH